MKYKLVQLNFSNNIYSLSLLIISLLLQFACGGSNQMIEKIALNNNWKVSSEDDSISFITNAPNEIHLDLFNKGIIDHPYFGDNEEKLQWIAKQNWIYEKSFDVDSSILKYKNLYLIFNGIDTYADIFLNKKKILVTDNQFREWRINVKDIIQAYENHLKIVIYSPFPLEVKKIKTHNFQPPGDPRIFTRKAPFVYGWDWAPRYVTSGIWKDIELQFSDGPELVDVFIKQKYISESKAELVFQFEIMSSKFEEVALVINEINQKVNLSPGNNVIDFNYSIENPKLWWIKELGEQHIYTFDCSIVHPVYGIQSTKKKTGLRTIALVQENDSDGKSFYFKLNGIPVFMKGANYIPLQLIRSKIDSNKYKELISDAVNANMNMLRVWGGGIYEHDIFYDLCDEFGILVWQDFMFANGMYPADKNMLDNITVEVEQQIKRLRNHPSVALWCGNNEIAEAWVNWGWKNNYTVEQQKVMADDYDKIFHQLLPKIVEKNSYGISYWPSSPQFGRGDKRSLFEGDSHYWGIWHDSEPFEMFEKKVPRFMSEFGFQSYPYLKTLANYFNKEDLNFESPILQKHQKHPRGNDLIKEYMQRDYFVPEDFNQFIYLSQLLQAEGISLGIEAHRRSKPYCMGSLYWQLNDTWPAISWSGIDYEGRWKALHYFVKRYFEPIFISIERQNTELNVFLINDKPKSINGELVLYVYNFNGEQIKLLKNNITVSPNSSKCYLNINIADLNISNPEEIVLNFKFISNDNLIFSRNYFLVKPKEMNLIDPEISYSIKKETDHFKLIFSSKYLAKNVFVEIKQDGKLSDNYFDLIPGEKKEIEFYPKTQFDEKPDITVFSLWDIFNSK